VVTLTFMVGVIRLGMGLLKLGVVVNFLSRAVINGFTSAAAIVIGLSQVEHLLGLELPRAMLVPEPTAAVFSEVSQMPWTTMGGGAFGVFVIILGKKIHPLFPSQLIAVAFGALLVVVFRLYDGGVRIVGDVPGGFPNLSLPGFDLAMWRDLFPIALTIAL